MTIQCPQCTQRKQNPAYDKARCAFKDGMFTPDNWDCATMNYLREAIDTSTVVEEDAWNVGQLFGVSWRSGDSSFGVIEIPFEFPSWLVMTWYKDRCTVSQAWVMRDDDLPRPVTYDDVQWILSTLASTN